jgi:mono/diheme cytochrome c family protein
MSQTTTKSSATRLGKNWLWLIGGLLIGGIIAVLLVIFVGMPLALGHRSDLPLEKLYADMAVGLATSTQAGSATNPNGNSRDAIASGRASYTGSCAVCHGANGDGKGAFGAQMYPPASDLRGHDTQEKTDAQLFWIIKNGLSFAGMPGFANQYTDRDIWNLVSYTRALGNQQSLRMPEMPPAPTAEQLAFANPQGDAAARGAAIYFANGCNLCHGAVGNASGELGLRGGHEAQETVRRGRHGMPSYNTDKISDAQLSDLVAYLNTFKGRGGFGGGD